MNQSNSISLLALVVAIVALIVAAVGLRRGEAPTNNPPSSPKAVATANAENSVSGPPERIKKLLLEVLATQLMAAEAAQISYDRGLKPLEDVFMVYRAMLNTKLSLCASKDERAKVYTEMIAKLATYEELTVALEAKGQITRLDVLLAKNERLLVQIRMERENLSPLPAVTE